MRKKACILLPTYNEAENVKFVIPKIFVQAGKIPSHELHVLVVDDNSPDGTQDVVYGLMKQYKNLHLISGEKEGLGEAYKRGMAYVRENLPCDLVFEMDADGQHDAALIPLFVDLANHGFSLVIGSRFAPGGSTPDFSFRRKLISLVGNWMIRFLGGLPRIPFSLHYWLSCCEMGQKSLRCRLSFLTGSMASQSCLCRIRWSF
jgi:dolichol-phosphate mannosyltransferase